MYGATNSHTALIAFKVTLMVNTTLLLISLGFLYSFTDNYITSIKKKLDDNDKEIHALKEQLQSFISSVRTNLENVEGSQSDVLDKTEQCQVQMKELKNHLKETNSEVHSLSKLLEEHKIICLKRIQSLGVEDLSKLCEKRNVECEQNAQIYFDKIEVLSKSLDEIDSKHKQNHEVCLDKINKFETASLEQLTAKVEQNSKTLHSMMPRLDNLSDVYVDQSSYDQKMESFHQQLQELSRYKRNENQEVDVISFTPTQQQVVRDMNFLRDEFSQVLESSSTPQYQRFLEQIKTTYNAVSLEIQPRFKAFEKKYKDLLTLLSKLNKKCKVYRYTDQKIYDYYTRRLNHITNTLTYLKARQEDFSKRMKELDMDEFARQSLDNQMLQTELRTNYIVVDDELKELLKKLQKLEEEMNLTDNGS